MEGENFDKSANSADEYALRKVIHDMIPLIKKEFDLYQDVVEKLQETPKREKKMTFCSTETVFSKKPSKLDLDQLDQQLTRIRPRLKQLSEERRKRKIANEIALTNLSNEIDLLKKEIATLSSSTTTSKRQFVTPARKSAYTKNYNHQTSLPL